MKTRSGVSSIMVIMILLCVVLVGGGGFLAYKYLSDSDFDFYGLPVYDYAPFLRRGPSFVPSELVSFVPGANADGVFVYKKSESISPWLNMMDSFINELSKDTDFGDDNSGSLKDVEAVLGAYKSPPGTGDGEEEGEYPNGSGVLALRFNSPAKAEALKDFISDYILLLPIRTSLNDDILVFELDSEGLSGNILDCPLWKRVDQRRVDNNVVFLANVRESEELALVANILINMIPAGDLSEGLGSDRGGDVDEDFSGIFSLAVLESDSPLSLFKQNLGLMMMFADFNSVYLNVNDGMGEIAFMTDFVPEDEVLNLLAERNLSGLERGEGEEGSGAVGAGTSGSEGGSGAVGVGTSGSEEGSGAVGAGTSGSEEGSGVVGVGMSGSEEGSDAVGVGTDDKTGRVEDGVLGGFADSADIAEDVTGHESAGDNPDKLKASDIHYNGADAVDDVQLFEMYTEGLAELKDSIPGVLDYIKNSDFDGKVIIELTDKHLELVISSPVSDETVTSMEDARDNQRKIDLKAIVASIESYKLENGAYPEESSCVDLIEGLEDSFMTMEAPVDPLGLREFHFGASDSAMGGRVRVMVASDAGESDKVGGVVGGGEGVVDGGGSVSGVVGGDSAESSLVTNEKMPGSIALGGDEDAIGSVLLVNNELASGGAGSDVKGEGVGGSNGDGGIGVSAEEYAGGGDSQHPGVARVTPEEVVVKHVVTNGDNLVNNNSIANLIGDDSGTLKTPRGSADKADRLVEEVDFVACAGGYYYQYFGRDNYGVWARVENPANGNTDGSLAGFNDLADVMSGSEGQYFFVYMGNNVPH